MLKLIYPSISSSNFRTRHTAVRGDQSGAPGANTLSQASKLSALMLEDADFVLFLGAPGGCSGTTAIHSGGVCTDGDTANIPLPI